MKPSRFFWPFFLLWVYGLLIYPIWLAFPEFSTRIILFVGLLAVVSVAGYFLYRWTLTFPEKKFSLFKEHWKLLLWLSIVYFIVQLPFLVQDLPPLSDESFHISRGIWLMEPAVIFFQHHLGIDFFWVFRIAAIILLGILWLTRKNIVRFSSSFSKKSLYLLPVLLLGYFFLVNKAAVLYHALKFGTPVLDHLNWLTYYGPVSALLYGLEFSFSGYSELGMRVLQPFFTVGAAFYFYQLLALRLHKQVAFAASVLFLFSPLIFYFASLSYLEAGQLFFLAAASHYFVRSRLHSSLPDMLTSFFFIAAGFMYKQPVLFLLPIFAAYLLLEYFLQGEWNIVKIFKERIAYVYGALFALVGIGPLLVINIFFDVRHTGDLSIWSQWLSFKAWSVYLGLIPRQTNFILFFLFLLGLIFALFYLFQRNAQERPLLLYLLLWFAGWYLIHMSYIILMYKPVRIMVPYIPAVIGLSIFPLHLLLQFRKRIGKIILVALVAFTLTFTLALAYNHYEQRYVPMNEMFAYIQEYIPKEETILATTSPHPYDFYRGKYQLEHTFDYTAWKPYDEQTPENLYEYMGSQHISYALFIAPRPNFYDFYPSDHPWNEYQDCEGRAAYQQLKEAATLCPLNADVVRQLEKGHPDFNLIYASDNGYNKLLLFRIY